jgi:hypothetical protein
MSAGKCRPPACPASPLRSSEAAIETPHARRGVQKKGRIHSTFKLTRDNFGFDRKQQVCGERNDTVTRSTIAMIAIIFTTALWLVVTECPSSVAPRFLPEGSPTSGILLSKAFDSAQLFDTVYVRIRTLAASARELRPTAVLFLSIN